MKNRMTIKFKMATLLLIALVFANNSGKAQNTTLDQSNEVVVYNSIVNDKVLKLDVDTKQISFWALSDYNANPKDYSLKILSEPSAGKASIAKDGVSIIYSPNTQVINDKLLIEVCHISGKCDQAYISFVPSTDRIQRSNTSEQ